MDDVKWTIEYFEQFNKRAEAVGFPPVIIDKVKMKVYKDLLHQLLDIGVKLEG